MQDISKRLKSGRGEKTGLESLQELSNIRRSAFAAVQCLLETDAPLLFDPSNLFSNSRALTRSAGKLALAAVRSGYKSGQKNMEIYMKTVISKVFEIEWLEEEIVF